MPAFVNSRLMNRSAWLWFTLSLLGDLLRFERSQPVRQRAKLTSSSD
jgi:hypothetical protein